MIKNLYLFRNPPIKSPLTRLAIQNQEVPESDSEARALTEDTDDPDTDQPCSAVPVASSAWRTFSSRTLMFPPVEECFSTNFIALSFMMYADNHFNTLIKRENCISGKYYTSYAELTFKTPSTMTFAEFDYLIQGLEDQEMTNVYKWIPTWAVKMGRRGCYCPLRNKHPYYKINVVTDENERFDTFSVTVFENGELLRRDLDNEIEFYIKRKGIFLSNTSIHQRFPSLRLPSSVQKMSSTELNSFLGDLEYRKCNLFHYEYLIQKGFRSLQEQLLDNSSIVLEDIV